MGDGSGGASARGGATPRIAEEEEAVGDDDFVERFAVADAERDAVDAAAVAAAAAATTPRTPKSARRGSGRRGRRGRRGGRRAPRRARTSSSPSPSPSAAALGRRAGRRLGRRRRRRRERGALDGFTAADLQLVERCGAHMAIVLEAMLLRARTEQAAEAFVRTSVELNERGKR